MFTLAPMENLTRFRRRNIKSEVYLVTEDVRIKSHGILLAARSAKLEKMVDDSENIPAVEFSDNLTGLEGCLDLVYGGSVDISEENCKSIYKFGQLFQIREMMDGVLSWIAVYLSYDKFWKVYLELNNVHEDTSVFVDILKGYLVDDGDRFMKHTAEVYRSQNENATIAVVELLPRIDDIRALSVDTATENNETLVATASSTGNKNYLQTVVSSVVTYIENCLKSNSCSEFRKSHCKETLQKASSVCTNMETLRKIIRISLDTSIQLSSCWNLTAQSIKDLNWGIVEQLSSPKTSYDAIKYFTANAGTGIHPCVVVEIVLKWWSVRTDREHVDMSFITPLITTIQNVSSLWYHSVCMDEKYGDLTKTLDIPAPTTSGYIAFYRTWDNKNNKGILEDCISTGDGTPAQFVSLYCTQNMQRYRKGLPPFRDNAAVFPPYGDTKYHYYIKTYDPDKHISLITDSKEELLNYINNTWDFELHFVPLPYSDTLKVV